MTWGHPGDPEQSPDNSRSVAHVGSLRRVGRKAPEFMLSPPLPVLSPTVGTSQQEGDEPITYPHVIFHSEAECECMHERLCVFHHTHTGASKQTPVGIYVLHYGVKLKAANQETRPVLNLANTELMATTGEDSNIVGFWPRLTES